MTRYVAMSHDDAEGWKRMDEGPAKHHWRARPDADEVIAHAAGWTGHLNIPEMQVLDLETDTVIWRGTNRWHPIDQEPRPHDRYTAQALAVAEQYPPIEHPADPWWQEPEAGECPTVEPAPLAIGEQGALL